MNAIEQTNLNLLQTVKEMNDCHKKLSSLQSEIAFTLSTFWKAYDEQMLTMKLTVLHDERVSAKALSEIIGLSASAVYKWEAGCSTVPEWYWYLAELKPEYLPEFSAYVNALVHSLKKKVVNITKQAPELHV